MASLISSGCSVLFVKPAKVDDYPNPECTRSRAAPVIDTVLAVAEVTSLLILSTMDDTDMRNLYMMSAGMWAGIYTGSAIYGYRNTRECAEGNSEGWERPESLDPDYRPPPPKKRPTRLVPEPGVMRSN